MERYLVTGSLIGQPHNQKISEAEILQLQEFFLTPGYHQLQFSNLKTARTQLYAILDALQFYHQPAVLSAQTLGIRADLTDLYSELLQTGCVDLFSGTTTPATTTENLVNFCLERFYYDFLWIEKPSELVLLPWYTLFLELLADFKFDQLLPICLVEF